MSTRNLDALLAPRAVALVGASARPGALGAALLDRLTGAGFEGAIGLVNPGRDEIAGRACAARAVDLPFRPDLGVVATPPEAGPQVIADLAAAGARAAVVITAGFTPQQRAEMRAAAAPSGMRILGPNCVGLQVPRARLDASFAHLTPRPGGLALISQSGAIVTAMVDWAEGAGLGFSVVASMGDMSDVDVGDLLDHLARDRETRAILMYLEQITDARKFLSAARTASRAKPVIAVKAGRSAAAAKAAASHTGALAGSDAVYDAALRRAGVLRVDDLTELFDAAETLARLRPLSAERVAIVTNGGGAGVLAADATAAHRLPLAPLTETTLAALDAQLPANWSRGNPIDIIGDAGPERYRAALEAVLADETVDAVLAMTCPTALTDAEAVAETLIAADQAQPRGARKPIVTAWLGAATAAEPRRRLEAAGAPVYDTPGRAVRGLSYLARHRRAQAELSRTPPSLPDGPEPDRDAARAVLAGALGDDRRILTEPEAKAVLRAYGVPTVETVTAADPIAAEAAAAMLLAEAEPGGAVVVKILSRDITHKSDVGGVRLNIATAAEARVAAEAMIAQARAAAPDARIDGVAVQRMIQRQDAHELILGIADDPVFGPVMLVGAGGASVEVVADKALALPPLDMALADAMIAETRIARLLRGYRDRPAADLRAVAATLSRLSQMSADLPEIRALDVNPLLVDAKGVIALDARIEAAPASAVAPGGNPRFAIRPYPAAWESIAETSAGARLKLRPLRPDDESRYAAFLAQVAPADLRRRFFGAMVDPGHEQLAPLVQLDYARAMAFGAFTLDGAELHGVARLAAEPDLDTAEFALLVRSDRQRRGVGRLLMAHLAAYADAEGVHALTGSVLADNAPMRALCTGLGFEDAPDREEPGLRRMTRRRIA